MPLDYNDLVRKNFITAFDAICLRDKIKARDLCRKIEANETVLSALRKNKGNIKGGYLATLVEFGVSPHFLLTGQGLVFGSGDKMDEIITMLRGLRNITERALEPLIDGYIEIKVDKGNKAINRISKQ